ncbi:MAG: hypothetical protein DRQ89_15455, partial [Epsilonproteobacteria bacterium]
EVIGECGGEYASNDINGYDYADEYCYCITWTWDIDDGCGNTASYMQVAMITDSEGPTYEPDYAAEITVQCDEEVPAFSPVWSDNCTPVDELIVQCISGITPIDCVENVLYTISRSCSATDACGNTTTVSQLVKIVDFAAPVITGTAQIDIDCSIDDYDFMYVLYDNVPTVDDNCDEQPSLDHSYQWYDATCGESIVVVWTAADQCGNASAFTQTYTIVDNEAPVMLCDFSATEGFTGPYAPENWVLTNTGIGNGSVDESNAPVSITLTGSDDPNGGNSEYTYYTTTVAASGAISFSWEVTEEDCDGAGYDYFGYVLNGNHVSLATVLGSGNAAVNVEAGDEFAFYAYTTDNWCGPIVTIASDFLAGGTGEYECGDDVPAMPENLDDFLAGGGMVSDNCELDYDSYTAVEVSEGSCPETVTRTFTIADLCGNMTTCVYVITIDDTTAPVLVGVPQDMDVECDAVPSIEDYVVTAEDCSDVIITTSELDIFDPLLICEFGDADLPGTQQDWSLWLPGFGGFSDNWVAVGSMILTELPGGAHLTGNVVNATDPTAGFAVDVMFHNKADHAGWIAQMTTDNLYQRSPKIFDPGQVGNEFENWDYYEMDESAATLTGTGILAGSDFTLTHAPANLRFAFQVGNGANNMGMGYGYGGWFDMHGTYDGEDVMVMGDFGGSNGDGDCDIIPGCYDHTLVYTWTATDACDNTASASATLNVVDTTDPIFTDAPADMTLECDQDVPALEDCIATDNCTAAEHIVYTSSESSSVDGCTETITRTWTATDLCENTATHTQTITIVDTTAPVISDYPADLTVTCFDLVPPMADGNVVATDNCNEFSIVGYDVFEGNSCVGTVIRTYTATDICGNASSVTQLIHINDDVAPM